jgi:hypothetical protein
MYSWFALQLHALCPDPNTGKERKLDATALFPAINMVRPATVVKVTEENKVFVANLFHMKVSEVEVSASDDLLSVVTIFYDPLNGTTAMGISLFTDSIYGPHTSLIFKIRNHLHKTACAIHFLVRGEVNGFVTAINEEQFQQRMQDPTINWWPYGNPNPQLGQQLPCRPRRVQFASADWTFVLLAKSIFQKTSDQS